MDMQGMFLAMHNAVVLMYVGPMMRLYSEPRMWSFYSVVTFYTLS